MAKVRSYLASSFVSLKVSFIDVHSFPNHLIATICFVHYVPLFVISGRKQVKDNIVIATKFAAYPWRLTPGQFVNACK